MPINQDSLKTVRQRKYLGKDFDALRAQLLEYARLYYPDKIRDFSEASLGGLLLDMAAYVGDNMSFYLDHQYGELNHDTAVENINIERSLRSSGVPIQGAAPALVPVTVYIQVPAERTQNVIGPATAAIPIVQTRSVFLADNGVEFILLEDLNYNQKRSDGTYVADVRVSEKTRDGTPTAYTMALAGLCISGKETIETFNIGTNFIPFRQLTLSNPNVSEMVSVTDGLGNVYHNVSALTDDVIYRNVLNTSKDSELVKDVIKIVPAPYRYINAADLATRKTTLTFGGGSASTLEDDVIPDPSDFAISFPYSKTFSRIPINPQQLLQTKTLGVAAVDTTLTVTYRYGGGLNHNVSADTIKTVKTLKMFFSGNPQAALAATVRNSIEVSNKIPAAGAEDAPSADDLKSLIPSIKNSQERIATRPDLLARVYTLPSNFGRVFRAAIRSNPNNPLATQLFIVSRDPDSKLIMSPDALKQNLRTYLNPYRMISDAIDVLDARVINLTFSFDVLIDPMLNRSIVLQNILTKLQTVFDIKNFHIDQPIVISDIRNNIFTTLGVISINNLSFQNVSGRSNNRTYSDNTWDVAANTRQDIIFPPEGGIFEVRYPEFDVVGKVAS
jgi:hypothetical protein